MKASRCSGLPTNVQIFAFPCGLATGQSNARHLNQSSQHAKLREQACKLFLNFVHLDSCRLDARTKVNVQGLRSG